MKSGPFVLARRLVSEAEFIQYWAPLYSYGNEARYDEDIGRPLTPERVRRLFEWKNGGRLSRAKAASVEENFVGRIGELEDLDADTEAVSFLERFSRGGAIWRIYWLHLWAPQRFPIYDQHVHRAMAWITQGAPEEVPRRDKAKIRAYLEAYLPFMQRFSQHPARQVDRALWTCGKHMKQFAGQEIGTCAERVGVAHSVTNSG